LHPFATYINEHHDELYKYRQYQADVGIACYDAKAQYTAFLHEMRRNITWYDPQFQR